MTERIKNNEFVPLDKSSQVSLSHEKLRKSNATVKRQMVEQLLSIGIDRESIARILNLKLKSGSQ